MAPVETEPAAECPPVQLGDRFEILPGTPAGDFRSPDTEAYRALDRQRPNEPRFALICTPGVPPRLPLLGALTDLRADALLKPLGWGVVDWLPRERRCFALVFEQPESRLAAQLSDRIEPVAEDDVFSQLLPPLMAALRALFDNNITHRGVRPTNLFRRAGSAALVLGECVSGPAGAAQPLVCEPIESGLAAPAGRGAGTQADDLYALGFVLVYLLLGRDPTQGVSDEALIADKINRGSFAAIVGGAHPPLRSLEAIRGLLADDPRERWTLAELEAWLERRRVAGRQFPPPRRAARPFELGDAAYATARGVAHGFTRDAAAAVKAIRSGELEGWLLHGLGDAERGAAFATALAEAGEPDGAARDARLVARAAMALDPAAPVRHGSFAAAIDGFGPALAAAFRAGSGAPAIADAIMTRLPHFWLGLQGPLKPEQAQALRLYDRVRLILEDRRPGFGLQRLLYELNSGMHCLAPAIEREHVLDAADLLPALERAAAAGRLGESVIDRHLAAFIAVRCKTLATDWLDDIASATAATRVLGTLKALAHLQGIAGRGGAATLGGRIARELPALIERYRSRTRRARLMAGVGKLGGRGDLAEMLALVANPVEQQQDDAEFRAACGEQAGIEQDYALLRAAEEQRPLLALELGGQLAVAAAGALAAAIFCVALFVAG